MFPRKRLAWVCATLLLMPSIGHALQLSLYDTRGYAVAYLDTDQQMTVYLWDGQPVAYVDGQSLYGFNGRHLGWLKNRVVVDHDGYAVGFTESVIRRRTRVERIKGLKQLTPLKALPQLEPMEPLQAGGWSDVPLDVFLSMGRN